MPKDELIKLIEDSIITEELAIPIYKKHLSSAIFWSGFKDDDAKIIKDDLELLTQESRQHIIILNKLRKILERRK